MSNPIELPDNVTIEPEANPLRPWIVYSMGLLFIVLLFVCYVQADVALAWMESIVNALFL